MKILHYSLGFPPYRSGGLTKFCIDLAKEQIKEGHDVSLLWPGRISLLLNKTKIKKGADIDGIHSFEVINPTPVSYDEGIVDFERFQDEGDKKTYQSFLEELKPDVIHIHTFMGLHKNLLIVAKELGIRSCFTTHDFFPICPKVTLFRNGSVCSDAKNCSSCSQCNQTALSFTKIKLLQSPLYRNLKDTAVVKAMRKTHRDDFLSNDVNQNLKDSKSLSDKYLELRQFYESCLALADVIHFNSKLTEKIYRDFYAVHNAVVLPITHADVKRKLLSRDYGNILKISYLGPQSAHKGYYLLKNALDALWEENKNFVLNVYFEPVNKAEYERAHERYSYDRLETVLEDADIVIVPSIWFETFGYTVLEALSFAVPVVVSCHVGAQDIIPDGGGIIFDDFSASEIKEVIKGLSPMKLKQMNHALLTQQLLSMKEMSRSLIENCYTKR